MAQRYPILLSGKEAGTLSAEKQGLWTIFSARCRDPGTLVRLSVYGDGAEGYLGVMAPEDGALTLRRRLTPEDMRAFPQKIEYASEAGGSERSAVSEPQEKRARCMPRHGENDVIWTPVGDGSLFSVREGKSYRAFPMAAWGLPLERAVERRVIEGVEYAVFSLTDGRIL